MDGDLLLIFTFIIIVTAVLGLSVNGVVAKVLDYKKSQGGIANAPSNAAIGEVSDHTAMIEDRLAVLERIATDRGQLLSDEIDALRDTPARKEEQNV